MTENPFRERLVLPCAHHQPASQAAGTTAGSGGRSSAAAFLLAQAGYDVCFVAHGAIDELGKQAIVQVPAVRAVVPDPISVATPADALVDAEVRAQALAAEVEKARFQNSTAQREEIARRLALATRIKDRATAAKRTAEQRECSLIDEIAGKLGLGVLTSRDIVRSRRLSNARV